MYPIATLTSSLDADGGGKAILRFLCSHEPEARAGIEPVVPIGEAYETSEPPLLYSRVAGAGLSPAFSTSKRFDPQ